MLVLRRAVGEKVTITVAGITIGVKIVDIQGQRTRIGFDAPMDAVRIVRDELNTERKSVDGIPESPLPVIRIGERLPGELMRRKPE